MELELFEPLAIALGLGLLVGLQRQWKESQIAGIRTFPLITLLGTLAVLLDDGQAGWVTAAGLLAVVGLLYTGNMHKVRRGEFDPGLTTEAAALLMYAVGGIVMAGHTAPAVAIAGTVAVLLHWKEPLHSMVEQIGHQEFKGIIHLVLIALVILPVLPNEEYGPYNVLNPYKIWLMVVLIVGISLVAYTAFRLLGTHVGAVLGGILGGLISSTATTVSYARQTRGNADLSGLSALVILLASTIVNARVLLEIALVSPQTLRVAALPLLAMMAWMSVLCLLLFLPARRHEGQPPSHGNPAQLKAAIVFGALYAVVLFVVAAARDQFGAGALYIIALISGLTDVDAITLSTAGLVNRGQVQPETAWRVILVATLSNLVFKAGAVAVLGDRRLLWYTAATFGLSIAAGLLLLAFWPDLPLAIPEHWLPPSDPSPSGEVAAHP